MSVLRVLGEFWTLDFQIRIVWDILEKQNYGDSEKASCQGLEKAGASR